MRHKVAFKTLGCRLNQYESDALAQKLEAKGFSVVDFKEIADVYVVNTCSVTAQSDQKSRTAIHHAARREHKPVVVFTGCMADNQNSKMPDSSEITYRVGNKDKNSIAELVEAHFAGEIFPAEYLKADRFAYGLTPQQSRVITSYSIHYTKLYDAVETNIIATIAKIVVPPRITVLSLLKVMQNVFII